MWVSICHFFCPGIAFALPSQVLCSIYIPKECPEWATGRSALPALTKIHPIYYFFPSYNPSQYLEASSGFPSEHYSSTRNDRISLLALEKHSLATGKSLSHTWRKSTTTNSRVIVIENAIISGNLMPRGMRWWWCSSPWQPKPQEKQTLNFLAWIN